MARISSGSEDGVIADIWFAADPGGAEEGGIERGAPSLLSALEAFGLAC